MSDHLNPGLSYHRRKAAKCLRCGWSRDDLRFTEYAWSRSLDKSPRRPLAKLSSAERAIRERQALHPVFSNMFRSMGFSA